MLCHVSYLFRVYFCWIFSYILLNWWFGLVLWILGILLPKKDCYLGGAPLESQPPNLPLAEICSCIGDPRGMFSNILHGLLPFIVSPASGFAKKTCPDEEQGKEDDKAEVWGIKLAKIESGWFQAFFFSPPPGEMIQFDQFFLNWFETCRLGSNGITKIATDLGIISVNLKVSYPSKPKAQGYPGPSTNLI